MKLWYISQDVNDDYDTYDSAVVAAETEEQARLTHPSGYEKDWNGIEKQHSGWCDAVHVTVRYIGEAAVEGVSAGVVCASFNAG